jgi:microcystin-dependent protein
MQPSIERIKASDGTGNASIATIQNSRSPGASTIIVDTVLGINAGGFVGSMGTPHTFTDPITSETITVISEATAVDFSGHVDGSNIEIDDIAPGYTDDGSEVGDIVIIRPTTQYGDNLATVLEVAHEDDGELKPDAAVNSPQGSLDKITPIGSILDFAGTSAPTGWLLCYGQTLDASANTQYQDLFDVIGNTFGGTNNTDFVVPDLRGRVVAGQDDMGGSSANRLTGASGGVNGDTFGAAGGAETHTLITAEIPAHTHPLDLGPPTETGGGTVANSFASPSGGTTGSTGGGGAHNNVQPTLILNKIIKY